MKPSTITIFKLLLWCAIVAPFTVQSVHADCPTPTAITHSIAMVHVSNKVIPQFDGVNPAVISRELQAMGFAVAKLAEESTSARGAFIRTVPAACQSARVGSTVTIYISSGPAVPPVVDPGAFDPGFDGAWS